MDGFKNFNWIAKLAEARNFVNSAPVREHNYELLQVMITVEPHGSSRTIDSTRIHPSNVAQVISQKKKKQKK